MMKFGTYGRFRVVGINGTVGYVVQVRATPSLMTSAHWCDLETYDYIFNARAKARALSDAID
jgi:hypothetical protein